MKPYLQVEELTKSYGDRMLFDSITFGVNEGDKIGVIAKNGTGKTTLLRLLSGAESPDSGKITYRNDLRVGFLEQNPVFNPELSIVENLISAIPEHDNEEWDRIDKVKQMLSQLGINEHNTRMDHLSGGQIKRVALARVLLSKPDLLILDEPTNHLDISAIEWLENFLSRQRITLLMVTHD
ncbi:MAG: ATP-binding cassette domain-containing protein, partial [Duncaniella sp.]|nr:ATP-binding cassette domain-containing protein [Duncaniella sp.]